MCDNSSVEKIKKQVSKPLKITKAMEILLSKVVKDNIKKSLKNPIEKQKKPKKEILPLNPCNGKTKNNKNCTRKESENCDGFCRQHFNLEKEKANTVELIKKHMK
jgi:hypothetical protein